MKKIIISDIDWDIKVGEDVDTEEERKEIINSLPQKVELPIIHLDYWECDEYGVSNADWDYIDYISEEYGWLINSFIETII